MTKSKNKDPFELNPGTIGADPKEYLIKIVIVVNKKANQSIHSILKSLSTEGFKIYSSLYVGLNRDYGTYCQITFIPIRGRTGTPTMEELKEFDENLKLNLTGYHAMVFHNWKGHHPWGINREDFE